MVQIVLVLVLGVVAARAGVIDLVDLGRASITLTFSAVIFKHGFIARISRGKNARKYENKKKKKFSHAIDAIQYNAL